MKTPTDAVSQVLRFDSLACAEDLTGRSYKEDESTSLLGMAIHMEHSQNKRALLEFTDDTYWGMAWVDFKAWLPHQGFQTMFIESFADENGLMEEAICAWDPTRGALLWAESYGLNHVWEDPAFAAKYPPSINSGKVYSCWRGTNDDFSLEGASHGPVSDDYKTRHVDYDIREGLKHHLTEMGANGQFIKPWVKLPFLWLLTYMDPKTKEYDHVALTNARLAKLPIEVQQVIGYQP